ASRQSPPPEWMEQRLYIPPYEAKGYQLNWQDTSGERFVLYGDKVVRSRQQDTLFWYLEGSVKIIHLAQGGDTIHTLKCERGKVFIEKGIFIAEEKVRLITADSLMLETDYLEWEQARNLLTAPGWVRLQTPRERVFGEGLEYNTQNRNYKIRRTRGTFQSPML
ncbi:MAG: hypothetical protein NZ933_07455, partial [Bacteroidia bacterium]|nr:hypothetical protein [Bacteroidia bacterium]